MNLPGDLAIFDFGRPDQYARLWKSPYGWQIYPIGEINQIIPVQTRGHYIDHGTVDVIAQILRLKRVANPVMIDGGANIGNITMGVKHHIPNLKVHCFEAQRIIAQMLAGTVSLMSWTDVFVHNVALTDGTQYTVDVPVYDYKQPGSFGSIELGRKENAEHIRQDPTNQWEPVEGRSIDSYNFPQVDLLKLDVESMEEQVLIGAKETINRCKPIMFIEHIKSDRNNLESLIRSLDYTIDDKISSIDLVCWPN